MRIVPKYKESYGSECTALHYVPANPQQIAQSQKALHPNQNNIIGERSQVEAKLHNDKAFGFVTITTKNYSPSEINTIDPQV